MVEGQSHDLFEDDSDTALDHANGRDSAPTLDHQGDATLAWRGDKSSDTR